jgi:TolB-like protein/Tfp pilus assembly protein PilF
MSGFFEEIKRRKVYRVAVAYIVVAGGLIQLASAAFPAWELPNWALRLVIVLLLIGFPIALILAWAFDVTPQGIRTTPRAESSQPTHRRRNLILLSTAGLVVSAVAGFFLLPHASARKMDKSIAVLPFENFSDDKENAYFADGIQDDVLTSLSKVGDLKVISRTSVTSYRGKEKNVREIGKALGVAAILEGSVRKSGNRVRVNVQLINAANDEHIWAEDYDRELTDVFAIQSELAHEITEVLRAKLSPDEKLVMERKPTQNNEAYLLYLQVRSLESSGEESFELLKKAEQLLERATQLDPQFALAFAELGRAESYIYHGPDPTVARINKARAAAAEALRLQPDLPEGHLALGNCYYYGDRDYERALQEYAIAQRGLPNDSRVFMAIGAIQRRQGKWTDSIANMKKAAVLDPRNPSNLKELAETYVGLRDYSTAAELIDRAIALAPNFYPLKIQRATLDLDWKGDPTALNKMLAAAPPDPALQSELVVPKAIAQVFHKNYEEAARIIRESAQDQIEIDFGISAPKEFVLGRIYFVAKNYEEAKRQFEAARPAIEASVAQSPSAAARHCLLGEVYAGIGRKDDAIREGKRAVELLPESIDAFQGPQIAAQLAAIYAMFGDADDAVPLIEHLLTGKVGISVHRLEEPDWDGIRGDPRFQALIKKYGGKT